METANDKTTDNAGGAEKFTSQVAAFQKIWMETFQKLLQTSLTLAPDSAPPEMLRQMREGLFQGLARSWDEFLRSPQFLASMKQWLDNAMLLRKMTNEFLNNAHHELQGTAREDVDTIMLAIRHLEQRILDRLEGLEQKVEARAGATPGLGKRETSAPPPRERPNQPTRPKGASRGTKPRRAKAPKG